MKKKILIPIIATSVALTSSAVGVAVAVATGAIKFTNGYTVTWKNGEQVLEVDNVQSGDFPHYDGPTPVGGATETFSGWTPNLTTVTNSDQVYSATFAPLPTSCLISIDCIDCTVNGKEHLSETCFVSSLPVTYHFDLPSGEYTHGYPASGCVSVENSVGKVSSGYTYDETTGNLTITELTDDLTITARSDYSSVNLVYEYDSSENTVTLAIDDLGSFDLVDWGDGVCNTSLTHTYSSASNQTYNISLYLSNKRGNVTGFALSDENGELYSTGNRHITNINFTSNVLTAIPDRAFAGCTNLAEININRHITSIGDGVFSNCPKLTAIHIDDDNPTIHNLDNGFGLIDSETKTFLLGNADTIIPGTVTTIAPYAFDNVKLVNITIPSSVTTIKNHAFNNCSILTSVTFTSALTTIEDYAFNNCPNVKYYDFSELKSVPTFTMDAFAGSLLEQDIFCLPKDETLRSGFLSIIPSKYVMSINPAAVCITDYRGAALIYGVSAASGIDSVDWGDGNVTKFAEDNGVHNYSSASFSNQMVIRVYAKAGQEITGFKVMADSKSGCQLCFETVELKTNEEVTSIDTMDFSNSTLRVMCFKNIDDFTTKIADSTFPASVSSLTIPASIKFKEYDPTQPFIKDDEWYFMYKNVRSFRVYDNGGNNYTSFDDNIIYDLKADKILFAANPQLIDPKKIDTLPSYAFQCCTGYESIRIPEGIKKIEDEVFPNCVNLKKLYIPKSVTSIGDWMCSQVKNLEEIHVDELNPNYYSYHDKMLIDKTNQTLKLATANCTEFPGTIKMVAPYAMNNCMGIVRLDLSNVSHIGEGAFSLCKNLEEVVFGNNLGGVPFADDFAFANCTKIKAFDFRAITQANEIPEYNAKAIYHGQETLKFYYRVATTEIRDAFIAKGGYPADITRYLIGDEPIPSSAQ